MTIEKLIKQLTECIDEGLKNPTDKVYFNHIIRDSSHPRLSSMDYILTKDRDMPNAVVLCYDDGMY